MADPPLLTVDGIRASIGSYTVLSDVTLSVTAGKTTVVLGRNGAGKTTTLRTIMGFIKPTAGSVRFEGEPIDNLRVHEIVRRGIAYVPEDRGVFGPLSVEENLRLAAPPDADWDSVLELFPILRERMAQRAGQLSGGQQQMLTVARALLQRPKLLILDEPSKGLAPLLVDELMTALQTLSQQTTILVVEQNLAAARKLGDRFVVIDDGVTVAQGDIDELAADDGVVERFLTLSAVSSADQGA